MRQDSHGREQRGERHPTRPPRPGPARASARPRFVVLGAVGMGLPHVMTAALAALPSLVALPGPVAVPLAALGLLVVQAIGVLLAREMESQIWRRIWFVLLATTAVLLPLVALQAALSRVPFVALARGSAGPLLWSTGAVVAALVGLVGLSAVLAADAPEQASLLFLPPALLVPAVLGAQGDLDERTALAALAEASAVAAVGAALGWLLPRGARPLVAPVALGAQFILLWFLGFQPSFGAGRGAVVAFCAAVLLIVTAAAAVLVPLASLAARRFAHALGATEPADHGR